MSYVGARAVPTDDGFFGEYRLSRKSEWQRVQANGRDVVFSHPREAAAVASRFAQDRHGAENPHLAGSVTA
ncbi:hypothetical protein [Metarhizobium album]|uniref:hypothetical protein n=1 Tax=Metarhizobium album TaxID=2182425 RepID=UPI000FFF2CCA|nr:hypothetical protein [Rhizobium album]